jgi:hypothetical protein
MEKKKLSKEERKRVLKKIMGKTLKHPFADRCKDNGYKIYRRYIREEARGVGCGKLMLEWENETFWGYVVKKHIPVFNKVYKILKEHGNIGQKNAYTYGDIDVSVWIEECKDKKVIASIRHCSCADDNTHLFIINDARYSGYGDFKCRTVWPKQNKRGGYRVQKSKKYPTGWLSWGDDRDIKVPSITTYRERNFYFSYGDCRDKGYVFTYTNFPEGDPKVVKVEMYKIEHALWTLRCHLEMLQDYEANECR